MRKKNKNFNDLLIGTIKKFATDETYSKYLILMNWKLAIGDKLSSVTAIQRIENKVIYVCCKSAPWCAEIETVYKAEIIKRINEKSGCEAVTDIKCTSRGFYKLKNALHKHPETDRVVKNIDSVPISEEDINKANKIASNAPSKELAQLIKRAIVNNKKMEVVKKQDGWKKCKVCGVLHNEKGDFCMFHTLK